MEELFRTLFHKKQHVMQFKEYGVEYVQEHRAEFEKMAYESEDEFINRLKKEGCL